MTPEAARVALVTAPDMAAAERIVGVLVEERLAACGNILPGLTSIYRWQDAVECGPEVLIVLKTVKDAVPALLERVPALHPYDVPEVLVLSVEAGLGPYLDWMAESTTTRLDE